MCESKEQLIGYVYDELDASERRMFEAHLSSCVECRDEMGGLRATRGVISAWTPPDPDFGFRIVRGAAAPPAAPRFRISPAWGLAAAAVLVIAIGAAIANVEVRYGSDGLVLRTGWNRQVAPVAAQAPAPPPVQWASWNERIDRLDRKLRELAASSRAQPPVVKVAGSRVSDADVLRRVREIVGESETRQQRELALRIRQVLQDVEARRRTDLATIQQGFGQIQGATNSEAVQHREIMNYLRLVSQSK